MYPIGNYSKELQLLLNKAQKEQKERKHPYIGTEHFLLALLKQKDNGLTKFLNNYNINYENFNYEINEVIGNGTEPINKEPFLTPLLTRVLSNAITEYGRKNEELNVIDVLLSLFEEGEGVAIKILINITKDDISEIHDNLLNLQKDNPMMLVVEASDNKNQINSDAVNRKGEIIMTYFYDLLSCFKEKEITHLRRVLGFKVNSETYDKFKENDVKIKSDFLNKISKSEKYTKKESHIENINACLLFNGKESIIILFNNKGETISKCLTELDVSQEVSEIFSRMKEYDDLDNIIEKILKDNSSLFITDVAVSINEKDAKKESIEKVENKHKVERNKKISRYNILTNLNEKVKLENTTIIGMNDELEKLIKSLLRMKKPNALITGKAGVGKTALVEKLACSINEGKVPNIFKNKTIVSLNMANAVAGTKYRGEFEEKLIEVVKFLEQNKDFILFIDEFHTVIGAGGAEGAIDAANILKPALARGEIKVIGATTDEEFDEFIKNDAAFVRRFNRVDVLEPTKEEVLKILKGVRPNIEKNYGIVIIDKVLEETYENALKREGRFPDIALDELEDYCIERYYDENKVKEEV